MESFLIKNKKSLPLINKYIKPEYLNNKDIRLIFNLGEQVNAKILIVGGAIRDFYLGRKVNDIDFAIDIEITIFLNFLKKKWLQL